MRGDDVIRVREEEQEAVMKRGGGRLRYERVRVEQAKTGERTIGAG